MTTEKTTTKTTKTISQKFNAAHRSGAPFVAISTPDIPATINEIIEGINGATKNKAIFTWDAVRGAVAYRPEGLKADEMSLAERAAQIICDGRSLADITVNPIEFLLFCGELPRVMQMLESQDNIISGRYPAIIFAMNLHRYALGFGDIADAPKVTVAQGIANLREPLKVNGSMIVLLGDQVSLGGEIKKDFLFFDQPLPNDEQLGVIFDEVTADLPEEHKGDDVRAQVVDAVRGATAFAAESIIAMNARVKTGIDLDGVRDGKRAMINATRGLTYYDSEDFDSIGGLHSAKEFFKLLLNGNDAPEGIVWIDEIEKVFGATGDNTGVAQDFLGVTLSFMADNAIPGIILLGHPGTGKSAIAKAAGSITNIPVFGLDMNGMKESLLGASGANLRNALKTLSGATSNRMLFVATSNGIEGLPPELIARFALPTFFFDLPSAEERESILAIWMKRFGLTEKPTVDMTGWVGRELRQVCEIAWRLNRPIDEVARWTVPSAISAAQKIEARGKAADGKFLSASAPGVYRFAGLPKAEVAPVIQSGKAGRRRLAD